MQWAFDVYPEMELWEGIVERSSGFKRAVRRLKRNYNRRTPNSLMMPQEFHTRKQVVDLFSKEVANKIKG